MHRYARIAGVLGIILVILILSPLFIGFYLEHCYQSIADIYSVPEKVNIQVERFRRGWFNSQATLKVNILDSRVITSYMNISDEVKDTAITPLIIHQNIQHGPIFYTHQPGLSYLVGFAVIQNILQENPTISKLFKVISDFDYISLFGNHQKYFKLASINGVYPRTDLMINIRQLQGSAHILAKQKKIQGKIFLKDIMLHNPEMTIFIPTTEIRFDDYSKMLFGDVNVAIPRISLIEQGITTFSLDNLTYTSLMGVGDGMLNTTKDIFIKGINVENYKAGPLRLNLSINKLNAKVVDEMVDAYHHIVNRGELYSSQLMYKMMMMFPQIFVKGTSVTLNNLDLKTQDGRLYIKGEALWNINNNLLPEDVRDIFSAADIKLYFQIAKPLMNRWIGIASNLPWFNQVSAELEQFYNLAREEMILTSQLNTFGIINLVEQGKLQENDAKILLSLQKIQTPTVEYHAAVKELLLNKIISGETSHMLLYLYTQSQAPLDSLKILLQRNQQQFIQSMSAQLERWIQAGYIRQQQNDYIISLEQHNNRIKLNTHLLLH